MENKKIQIVNQPTNVFVFDVEKFKANMKNQLEQIPPSLLDDVVHYTNQQRSNFGKIKKNKKL